MQVDRYKHFKWTPRTAWLSIIFAVVIPSSLYYVANKTDVSRLFQFFRTLGNAYQEMGITREEVKQEEACRGSRWDRNGRQQGRHTTGEFAARLIYRQRGTAKGGRMEMHQSKAYPIKLTNHGSITASETTSTDCIHYRASTSFAAREEATP